MSAFLADAPKYLFFTGKGGVGKTSLACASAVRLADTGKKVLLVSTDPASNVGQVFGVTVGSTLTAAPEVAGLTLLEIDPHEVAEAYRERIIGPVRGLLPEKDIAAITEQLSGSCTTEVASFNEFTDLLADESRTADFDHVIFDTAPTGHTIRMLQLPGSWTDYLNEGKGDTSCLGPMAGLEKQRGVYAAAVERLSDPATTRLVLVARAQASTLAEAERSRAEFAEIGLVSPRLVVNGVLPADEADPLAQAVNRRESAAIATMPTALAELERTELPLHPVNLVGLTALRSMFTTSPTPESTPVDVPERPLGQLVDELADADHGLIMCMGKGGVGKTTMAAALAVALADRGKDVHLTTTDPAAHVARVVAGADAKLQVSAIDPHEATEAYRERILATKGKNLDEAGRAALKEDLLSPCTEEIAVFEQFSKVVNESRRRFVVMDTAPTGHTLLLMDATGSYHRDVARHMNEGQQFVTPLMRLQDPELTRIIVVTLPESTPVQEAQGLVADLARADITPWGWIVNNSVAAAHPTSGLLSARASTEKPWLDVVAQDSDRIAIVPLLAVEPVGQGLGALL